MITLRPYRKADAPNVGVLIADTYREFNLSYAPPKERAKLLGPFYYARSHVQSHRDAILQILRAPMILVAEDNGEIVGVLRGGRKDQHRIVLQSLFVKQSHHRQGIGRKLVTRFERACLRQGATVIRLLATLYAIPFYSALGYKCSTGVRTGKSFEGAGFRYQPMRKILRANSRKVKNK
jgi:GNAT superfamily N-acetyltransferase